MWPFTRKKNEEEEIVNKAVNELDCHIHYEAYIVCMQKKNRFSYKKCIDLMDEYRYCLVQSTLKQKDEKPLNTDKIINPKLFS